jgi:hypothetical protein
MITSIGLPLTTSETARGRRSNTANLSPRVNEKVRLQALDYKTNGALRLLLPAAAWSVLRYTEADELRGQKRGPVRVL